MRNQMIALILSLLSLFGWAVANQVAGDQVSVAPPMNPLDMFSMARHMGGYPMIQNSGQLSLQNNGNKIKIGNTKTTSFHMNHQINAPNVKDSVYSSSTSGHDGAVTAPTNYANGRIEQAPPQQPAALPNELQETLKKKMIELFEKATGDSPEANHYKEKLLELLKMLDSSRLPPEMMEKLLQDAADGHIDQEVPAEEAPPAEEPPAEEPPAEEAPAPEFEVEEEPPIPEEVKAEVRGFVDDRMNRITDLLYFRPEFLNVMMKMDPCNELTPIEADFVRLVLCNSDPSLCNQPACPQPEELPVVDGEEPPAEEAPAEEPPAEEPPAEEPPADEAADEQVPAEEPPAVQASAWAGYWPFMNSMMPPRAPHMPPMPSFPGMPVFPAMFPQDGAPMVQSARGPAHNRVRSSGPQVKASRPGFGQLIRNKNFRMPA